MNIINNYYIINYKQKLKMENINVITNDSYESNISCSTGFTRNIGGVMVSYKAGRIFEEENNISSKKLQNDRKAIVLTLSKNLQPYYFTKYDEKFFYTERMLEFRKYKKVEKLTEKHSICFPDYELSKESRLFKKILKYDWHYACGSSYLGLVSVDSCVERMEALFATLQKDYPDARITLFYTTEIKNRSHNHFALSIFNPNKSISIANLQRAIRVSTGTHNPDVETMRKEEQSDFLRYIIKDVHNYPDGWAVISNSKAEIRKIRPRMKDGVGNRRVAA